jgi:hypothetical protein
MALGVSEPIMVIVVSVFRLLEIASGSPETI